ncbi:CDGSH iron-sulfur domain-containing protein [Roseovarius aestuariivivens]|uniref:CDGSH iron-sulfur domain-containing protein n=1 Tax=Roseovarius aestuariivivens TaxID=1888910 RepID=UPI00108145FD|nr:CDGSH iron-sulfur domain-containing protein [Roseovarius aestuariivivens]
MSDAPKIETRENGPLIVKNLQSLQDADGNAMETKKVIALCRCGRSGNKPFCDGSHEEAGFESAGGTPSGKDLLLDYEGKEVTVTYNPRVCSHAANCIRQAGDVFDPDKKPWIQPDHGKTEDIIAAVTACPSGALAIKEDGARKHLIADKSQLTVQRHGPYEVQGITPPEDLPAQGMTEKKYVLCRCGLSGMKPFCDGSHYNEGWRED